MSSSKNTNIVIIEDEKDIRELLSYNISLLGYQVQSFSNGESGLKHLRNNKTDLLLLDLMLPGIGGYDICRIIKSDPKLKDILIIMLTAKGSEADIVKGLELGADDYIVKPFSSSILSARIASVLRRVKKIKLSTLDFGSLKIDINKHQVFVDNEIIELTFSEFEILSLLGQNPGLVYTRSQIIDSIRGDNYPATDRTIDFQIVGLRKKLLSAKKYIKTIRGVGYKFDEQDES
jgi:two-component system alkaline phosphatase synthesis response regulator PhoP